MQVRQRRKIFIYSILLVVILLSETKTIGIGSKINTDVPDIFMGIKTRANARAGPGKEYPIVNIYVKRGEPVQVIEKNEEWIRIRDFEGEEGWIYKNLLSKKHLGIINSNKKLTEVFFGTSPHSKIKFYIPHKARCTVLKCKNFWCKIQFKSCSGWILKNKIWGV